jgi:hypothetical protein
MFVCEATTRKPVVVGVGHRLDSSGSPSAVTATAAAASSQYNDLSPTYTYICGPCALLVRASNHLLLPQEKMGPATDYFTRPHISLSVPAYWHHPACSLSYSHVACLAGLERSLHLRQLQSLTTVSPPRQIARVQGLTLFDPIISNVNRTAVCRQLTFHTPPTQEHLHCNIV